MLNTLRKLNESRSSYKSLTEQPEQPEPTQDNVNVINDVDIKLISQDSNDLELPTDQKEMVSQLIDSFREQVSQLADLKPGFTITETQVRLDGVIPDLDINFVLIAGDDSGLYLNADMLMLHSEVMITLEKLSKFEQSFKDTLEPLIRERKTN
jgi:hypothetical protein